MVSLMTMPVLQYNASTDLSPSELSQRVALLKRFRELLRAQRDRFRVYLDTLDKQQDIIQSGTTDDLLRHVELEEKIVEDIFSIQKVIDPLEKMYQSIRMDVSSLQNPGIFEGKQLNSDENEVFSLKEALKGLKAEAVVRSGQNRELLAKRMSELRSEIKSMKTNPYLRRKSSFDNAPTPSQIDIKM